MSDHRLSPNIIYIVCHDLGRELGCYGRGIETPHLDRFAAAGVRFESAVCNSVACSPSRACMMTGLYPQQNGVMGLAHEGWSMPLETPTIVDYLNADGRYETVHIGLQHERHPDGAGLNRYQRDLWTRHSDTFVENAVDETQAFLRSRGGGDRPFFLNVGLLETHPQRWGEPFKDDRVGKYQPFEPDEPAAVPFANEPGQRDAARRFQGAIRYMDDQLGRLFETMRELGTFDDSVVVFSTDHGAAMGPRGKGTLYEPGIGISLLVRMPERMAAVPSGGRVVGGLVQNMDLTPTFLEAAGVTIPGEVEGVSLWPVLCAREETPHDAAYLQRNYHGGPNGSNYYDPIRGCRTDELLYLRNYVAKGDRPAEELFDLRRDRVGEHNVLKDPAYASQRAAMSGKVDAWMERTEDPLLRGPIPDPHGAL